MDAEILLIHGHIDILHVILFLDQFFCQCRKDSVDGLVIGLVFSCYLAEVLIEPQDLAVMV